MPGNSNGSKGEDEHSSRAMEVGRILAVDLRVSYFGYAVFETPAKILAFGVATVNSPDKMQLRISVLIKQFRPSVIVMRRLRVRSKRDRAHHASSTRIIRKEARSASIPTVLMSESKLWQFFHRLGKRNKYDVAALIANRFPDLAWKLPAKRKLYQPEPWTISLFDAAALGAAYLSSRGLFNID